MTAFDPPSADPLGMTCDDFVRAFGPSLGAGQGRAVETYGRLFREGRLVQKNFKAQVGDVRRELRSESPEGQVVKFVQAVGRAGGAESLAGAADLPAALQGLRDAVKGALQYHESWEKYDKDLKEYEKAKKDYEAAKRKREDDERKAREAKEAKDGKKAEDGKKEEPPKASAEEKKDEKKEEKKDDKKDEKKDDGKAELVEPKEPAKPGPNPAMEPWRDVFRRKLPVLCRAASAGNSNPRLRA